MHQNTPARMTQDEAASLTSELVAFRPDWRPASVMAAISRVHQTMDREQITNTAWVAASNSDVAGIADAFKPAGVVPSLPPAPAAAQADYERDVAILRISNALPDSFGELAAEAVAEHMFDKGVRRIAVVDGAVELCQGLRLLIDDLRCGQASADDLDTALNVLETRLCIPLTTADDGS